jgi:hypothetical protein
MMEPEEEDGEFRRPEVPLHTSTPRPGHGRQGASSDHQLGEEDGHEPSGHEGEGGDGDAVDAAAADFEVDDGEGSEGGLLDENESDNLKEGKCLLCGQLFDEPQAEWKSSQHNTDSLLAVYG